MFYRNYFVESTENVQTLMTVEKKGGKGFLADKVKIGGE